MQFYNFLPWSHQLQDLETYFCRTWFRIIVHGVNIDGTWSLWEVTIWFHRTQVSYLLFVFPIIMAMITMMTKMMLAMQIIIIWWKEERGGGRTLLLHCSSSHRSEPLRAMSLTSGAPSSFTIVKIIIIKYFHRHHHHRCHHHHHHHRHEWYIYTYQITITIFIITIINESFPLYLLYPHHHPSTYTSSVSELPRTIVPSPRNAVFHDPPNPTPLQQITLLCLWDVCIRKNTTIDCWYNLMES